MTKEIFRCKKCFTYTLKKICPICKTKTISPKPGKFNIEDKFSKYRIKYKNESKI